MRIATNIPALNTAITLKHTDSNIANAMQKLTTGSQISSAKYDSAGLAIANKLSVQISGLNQASQNSMDGISVVQTADGALSSVTNMIQRMRELAIQAANGVLTLDDKEKIQTEVNQLVEEIDSTADKTEFNRIKLLNGEANTMTFSKILGAPPGGDLGDGISTVLSSNLPPGQLNYTIDVPGFPAEVGLDAAALDAHPTDTTFVINGVSVTIVPMDDLSAIKAKLAIASESASLELKYNGNLALFSTINAGSSQVISITSADNPAIETQNTGTDAVLSALEFYNPDGSLNMEFNSTVGFIAEGNKVSIQSSNGLGIQLGIKVFFNPTVGSPSHNDYVYANGKASDVPPYSNGLPTNVPVSMASNIEDYGSIILQTGASFNQSTQVGIPRMDSEGLGLMEYKAGIRQVILDYSSASSVQNAIDVLDRSLSRVYGARANLGAYQNRLEQTVMNLDSASVYTESSRSRIQDTDMASAMTELTQNNIKYQAGIAILSQANQRPQQVLSLMQ